MDEQSSQLFSIGNPSQARDEPLADYLRRRERELMQQTAALRGALIPKEKELAEVHKAMDALGIQRSYAEALRPFLNAESQLAAAANVLTTIPQKNSNASTDQPGVGPLASALAAANAALTIKQMILSALRDHFHNGATPTDLRDYMKTVYNRDIDRNSISPQLARLRVDGMVDQLSDGKWKLSQHGRGIMRYGRGPDTIEKLEDL